MGSDLSSLFGLNSLACRKSREKSARSDTHGGGPHIRADSRVGRLLAEFGGKDDWVSMTIMRHQMAVVIQVPGA